MNDSTGIDCIVQEKIPLLQHIKAQHKAQWFLRDSVVKCTRSFAKAECICLVISQLQKNHSYTNQQQMSSKHRIRTRQVEELL